MKKLKTVKEVCKLTGLNRKLLYIYDKEGIVKASGYQNTGHEGTSRKSGVKVDYDGYKLYNEEAVRKLQQVAIYEKLHIKRTEIKKLLNSGKSDLDLLDEQIQMLEEAKKEIENLISVAEQLKFLGTKGEMMPYYATIDFAEFAKNEALWKESRSMKLLEELLRKRADDYIREAERVLNELVSISNKKLENEKTMMLVEDLFTSAKNNLGFMGWYAVIIMAISANGGGIGLHEMFPEYEEGTIINSAKTVLEYLKDDMNLLWEEYIEILSKHCDAIGQDYSENAVKELVDELKELLFTHMGLSSKEEYEIFFEFMKIALNIRTDKYLSYTLDVMEYYHMNAE